MDVYGTFQGLLPRSLSNFIYDRCLSMAYVNSSCILYVVISYLTSQTTSREI